MPDAARREHLLKIGVSGVRGVVGEFFTPAIACAFAQAFGQRPRLLQAIRIAALAFRRRHGRLFAAQ